MGFAVVADEVRNLAARSAEAAKNTQALLENSTARLAETEAHFREANEAISLNAQLGKKVSDLVAEISAASREQAQGIEQINKAVGQMDSVTQSNAANAEESASATQVLNSQAEAMHTAVDELLALVGSAQRSVVPAPDEPVRRQPTAKRLITAKASRTNGVGAPSRTVPAPAVPDVRVANRRAEIPLAGDFKEF